MSNSEVWKQLGIRQSAARHSAKVRTWVQKPEFGVSWEVQSAAARSNNLALSCTSDGESMRVRDVGLNLLKKLGGAVCCASKLNALLFLIQYSRIDSSTVIRLLRGGLPVVGTFIVQQSGVVPEGAGELYAMLSMELTLDGIQLRISPDTAVPSIDERIESRVEQVAQQYGHLPAEDLEAAVASVLRLQRDRLDECDGLSAEDCMRSKGIKLFSMNL